MKQQGDAGSNTRLVRLRLASIALCQGQEAESQRLLERALDPAPGEVAGWLPGRSQVEFGEALLRADRLDEAAPYLRRGYDRLLAAEGAKAGSTQSAARLLVKLYEKQGDAAAAAKWRAKQI